MTASTKVAESFTVSIDSVSGADATVLFYNGSAAVTIDDAQSGACGEHRGGSNEC
ncbi:hypothetical protein [Vibrio fortis]|uniref:hypothetical protein n=1 Tax=Vibrio fortis TaxID=212667 RepID=UPI0038CD76E9